ncbi:MAG: hypothetical protein ABFS86_14200 [Planctomycetota bacterium]
MTTRFTLAVLAVLLIVPAAAGYDATLAKQASVIYLTVEGRSHSILFVHSAVSARDGGKLDLKVKFHPDLPVWIGDEKLEPGERTWRLREAGPHDWTIGPASKDNKGRHALLVRKTGASREWLTAALTPHPSGDVVLLSIGIGDREGTLVLGLRKQAKVEAGGGKVDLRALVQERDRLLTAAAAIEKARRTRHLWTGLLLDLGNRIVTTGEKCWIDGFDFSRDDDWVRFGIRGHLHKDLCTPKELSENLQSGPLAKVFPKFLNPKWSAADEAGFRAFGVSAQIPAADWSKVEPLPARADGSDVAKVSEEILLLESRIAHLAPAMVTDLKQGRTLLLEVKREAMALISGIRPGTPEEAPSGLGTFEVSLKVTGSSAGIVTFLRLLEDRPEPLRIVPVSLSGTKFGPELSLKLVFLSVRPLSTRRPRVAAMAQSRGRGPDYAEVEKAYLDEIGSPGDRPFTAPAWKRDPFAAPTKDGE